MGKIRIKTFGDEETEKTEQKEAKQKKEAKKLAKVPGMHGGERVISVGPSEEELAKIDVSKEQTKKPKAKFQKERKTARSKRYQTLKELVNKSKTYTLSEGLELLEKLKREKADDTVELHINTTEAGVSATLTLPHGTGKQTRVVVADDALIVEIEKGKIEFDILVAEPAMMPKLAKVARILGPKGLMPNPKNGTVTSSPKELIKKFEGGQISFKTEAKTPIIHLTVGKMSFGSKKLTENIQTILEAIKKEQIANITLKSTMSPGIKIIT